MRVLVTGATGFVGSHVVEALCAHGHDVACLVRDSRKAARVFGTRPPALIAGDLADVRALERGCARAESVVHLAGLTAARSRAELFATNVDGARAVVRAVRTTGAGVRRFVAVSSLAAAGPASARAPAGTGAETGPVSDYGRSKLDGERPVRDLPCAWVILRPPVVYGPRDIELLRLFRLARLRIAPVFGDGAQPLSLVFAGDLANAIVRCLETELAPDVYYPAHPEPTTARALVEHIAAALDVPARVVPISRHLVRPLLWLSGGAAALSGRTTVLGPDKADEILAAGWTCSPASLEAATGWRAAVPLADGLRRTAAWYRSAGWL